MSEYTHHVEMAYMDTVAMLADRLARMSYYHIPNLPWMSRDEWDTWYATAYAQALGDRVARGKLTRAYRKGIAAFEQLTRGQEQP